MEFNKTDDELKLMNDDELFAYLDAKAEYMKKHITPLSSHHTKKFAYASAAIQNNQKGTDDIYKDTDYEKIKEIARKNEQDALSLWETKKNDKNNKTSTND